MIDRGGHGKMKSTAVVESVRAASDIHSPIAGVVTAANAQLTTSPDLINTDPYGAGWIVRMRPADTTAPQPRSMQCSWQRGRINARLGM